MRNRRTTDLKIMEQEYHMSYTTLAQSTADWALSKVGCAYSQARCTYEDIFDYSSFVTHAYSAQDRPF